MIHSRHLSQHLKKKRHFQGNKTKGYYMDKKFSIDIDTKFDFFDFLKFMRKQKTKTN